MHVGFQFFMSLEHILQILAPPRLNVIGHLVVGSKTLPCSTLITMLCNMTHAITTFAITLGSHHQQGLATTFHFNYKTP